jgi:hypothetical protein
LTNTTNLSFKSSDKIWSDKPYKMSGYSQEHRHNPDVRKAAQARWAKKRQQEESSQ